MRILVVEDERKTAAYLQRGLSESSFVVDTASRGDDGVELALSREYPYYDPIYLLPESGQAWWRSRVARPRAGAVLTIAGSGGQAHLDAV